MCKSIVTEVTMKETNKHETPESLKARIEQACETIAEGKGMFIAIDEIRRASEKLAAMAVWCPNV